MEKLRLRLERTTAMQIVAAILVGAIGCSAATDPELTSGDEATSSTDSAELVVGGTRETLVDSILGIENSVFTTTGRLFVTGDEGIYEITRDPGNAVRATVREAANGCKFAGIAEARGVLYVNCYDGTNSGVFAGTLDASPTFRRIHELPGVGLANGAAADDAGRIYVADSTHGTIWRLSIGATDPFSVTSREAFSTGNLFPNGVEFFEGNLYFTDFVAVKRIPLLAGGRAGAVVTLTTQLTFFDDLYVDGRGIAVANYLLGTITGLTPAGVALLDTVAFGFNGPSSVLPAEGRLGFSNKDILITEKNANRLSVFHLR
jgi:sugar lactone lactonase YvrE